MGWLKRQPTSESSDTDKALMEQAGKRLRKLGTSQILDTAEAVLIGMGDDLDDFRAEGDLSSIADMGLGAITMQAICLELKARRAAELGVDS